MILYKYLKYESGLNALNSKKCVFTKPIHFNDPFELNYLKKTLSNDNEKYDYKRNWQDYILHNSAITCFTKQPLNPLMWAHYADSHAGLVIGYEVEDPFFTSTKYNVVTIDDGDVIYSRSQPEFQLSDNDIVMMERLYHAVSGDMGLYGNYNEALRMARRLFLTKASCWSYEEEVRVVRGINQNISEQDGFHDTDKLKLCKPFDTETYSDITKNIIFEHSTKIMEVYMGCKAKHIPKECLLNNPECKFFKVGVSNHGWNLNISPL
jgi:hypothetical protein